MSKTNYTHTLGFAGLLAAGALGVVVHAAEIDIQQNNLAFEPDMVEAAPGDTIRWHWNSGSHTVTSGSSCTPDGLYFDEPLTSANPMVEYTIPADFEGELPYFCIPHCGLYMDGVIMVAGSSGTVHEVQQFGLVFDPADIVVEPGDTVRWIWNNGVHTVTSGSDCTYDETYFDALLDGDNPIFEWTVPDDFTGTLDYFCIPHCSLDMVGTITAAAQCIGDVDGDGVVGVGDLLELLAAWGPGYGPADINNSGNVDVSDLLLLLSAWGPC